MNRIKEYRKYTGLSQEDLARDLDVSRNTVSSWETGQYEPTIRNALRICARLLPARTLEGCMRILFPNQMEEDWYKRL